MELCGPIPRFPTCTAVSDDFKLVACGYDRGYAIVVRHRDRRKLWKLWGHQLAVRAAAFSADNRLLATSGVHALVIWDVRRGIMIVGKRLEHGVALAFSTDGRRVAMLDREGLLTILGTHTLRPTARIGQVWENATGNLSLWHGEIWLDWNRRFLLVWGLGKVVVVDPSSGKVLRRRRIHSASLESVVFSPDGRHVASLDRSGQVGIWDASNGEELAFEKPGTARLGLENIQKVFGLSGRYGAGLVRAGPAPCMARSLGVRPGILLSGYSVDNTTLVVQPLQRRRLEVWDLETGTRRCRSPEIRGFIYSLAVSVEGRLVAVGVDRSILWLDGQSCEPLGKSEEYGGYVMALDFSPDGRWLAHANYDSRVRVHRVPDGRELSVYEGHQGPVSAVTFAPDGKRIASGGFDTTVIIWDFDPRIARE
ncbi:MAG TPA: hypothetical protein VM425_12540 [Myxococcota bacterium]|nr:hypothetical protein [Myxococcota bacterium]